MRLINADALTELIKDHEKNLMHNITHSKTRGITTSIDFIRGVEDGYYRILSDIKQMSTVEAEPVKHGRWKPFDLTWGRSVYACTSCGEAFEVPTEDGKPIYDYCPNCGARMMDERK